MPVAISQSDQAMYVMGTRVPGESPAFAFERSDAFEGADDEQGSEDQAADSECRVEHI